MSTKPIYGHFTNSEKIRFWQSIFPDNHIPVTTMVPVVSMVHNDFPEPQSAYLLDWKRLDEDTRRQIARKIADTFGGQLDDVYLEIAQRGLPIREADLSVGIDIRFLI